MPHSKAQKWVADTLIVHFGRMEVPDNSTLDVVNIQDRRGLDPCFLSVFEKKKWIFFPVDQIIVTHQPVAHEVQKKFSASGEKSFKMDIKLHSFEVRTQTAQGKNLLKLLSTIELYKHNDSLLIGSIYYEEPYFSPRKEAINISYEKVIEEWSRKFSADMLMVQHGLHEVIPKEMYHFRAGQSAVKRNLYTSIEGFWGSKFWGVDAELWFSDPEAARVFNRQSRIIRYVNHPTFESIALGSNVRRWNYRFSEKWLFTHKMAFLIGVNKWKDMSTVAHKFEEIFLFNASMTQQLNYNPFDKTGLSVGIGLTEDLHYVIYHPVKFNLGISFNLALKF
jgi:hypothetical protein